MASRKKSPAKGIPAHRVTLTGPRSGESRTITQEEAEAEEDELTEQAAALEQAQAPTDEDPA